MIARCIFYVDDSSTTAKATVVLTPCWLARLLGARERSVDLRRNGEWYSVATKRSLRDLEHGELIRYALDFREVGSPARWALGAGVEAIAP